MRWIATFLALVVIGCASAPSGVRPAAPPPAPPPPPPAAQGGAPATSAAQPSLAPLPDKVTIAYSSISGDFLPLWITAEAGLFTKHGVEVEPTYIASGTTAM